MVSKKEEGRGIMTEITNTGVNFRSVKATFRPEELWEGDLRGNHTTDHEAGRYWNDK